MADKSFGVKELNLLNASGTPTVTSPNNLNLNANTVAISTSATVGNNLTVTSTTNSANLNVTGIGTLTRAFATDLSVSGVTTITVPANANPHSSWDVVNNSASAYRFTGPGQDGAEDNPNIYLVRGQRYVFKMNASGHPFQIRVANGGAAYSDGVTNNGSQTGNVVFNVQHDAPAQLYYQCTSHGSMVGNIYIVGGPQVISGVVTATTFVGALTGTASGNTTISSNGNDRIITGGSGNALTGEADLQFDGTNLFMPNELRHLGDPDTKMGFDTDTIKFETAGSERLRITSTGNVGIGSDLSGAGGAYGRLSLVIPSQSDGSALQVMNSAAGSGDGSLTNIVLRSVNNAGSQWAGAEFRAHDYIFKNQSGAGALFITSAGSVRIVEDGTFTANTGADELVVGNANNGVNRGMTIYNHSGSDGRICFAQPDDDDAGMIKYSHGSDIMQFFVESAEKFRVDSGGRQYTYDAGGSFASFRETFKSGAINNGGTYTVQTYNCHAGGLLTITANRTPSGSNHKTVKIIPILINSTSNATFGTTVDSMSANSGSSFTVAGASRGVTVTNTSGLQARYTITFDITGI